MSLTGRKRRHGHPDTNPGTNPAGQIEAALNRAEGLQQAFPLPASGSRPVFSPKDATRQTGAMPALGQPYADQPEEITPPIFKRLVAALPPWEPVPVLELGPPVLVEGEPYDPGAGPRIELYARPGWASVPNRDRAAEIDEMHVIVERGLGANAAETATAYRHARQYIARAARELCATLGEPGAVGALLRRVSELNGETRENTGPQQVAS